jgi:hypothetical protein
MRDELRLQTEIGEVLLNLPTNKGTEETEALGLTGVDFDNFLWEKIIYFNITVWITTSQRNRPFRNPA